MRSSGLGRLIAVGAGSTLILLAAGCGAQKRPLYLDQGANFGSVQRVAVLPLENFSNDPFAAEKVRQILTIELLRARAFEIVDLGEVVQALGEAKVDKIPNMTRDQIKMVGQRLNVQALMLGTVQEMSVDRSAGVSAPTVSLQFKMIDAGTGETIWSTVVNREGVGVGARLFGVGGESVNSAIQDLVREALGTLIR